VLAADELDLEAGCSLALELAHPLPECLYLALAMRLSVPLVTADQRFVRRASTGYAEVQLLSEFPAAGA
jgi:predicted nucleic acid-binding protein